MRRLRVVTIMPSLAFGGDEYRMMAFSRHVDRSSIDHKIVCIKQDDNAASLRPQYLAAGAEIIDIAAAPLQTSRRTDMLAWAVQAANRLANSTIRVCEIIRNLRADLIDAHNHLGNQIGILAGRLTNTPVLVTTYHNEQWTPVPFWYAVQQATLSMANAIITDADATRAKIQRWMILRAPPVYVIANGQDAPSPEKSAQAVQAEYDLPYDAPTIGMFARLIPPKGQLVLLDAARLVLREEPKALFLVCGYEPTPSGYRDHLIRTATEFGIRDRVRFISYPGPIGDMWQLVDVHVHPSLYDSLPNCIIEGMSLGKPAVVTDVGGVASLVLNERSGVVVPPNDPRALATALLRVLRSPDLAAQLGRAARARYVEICTARAMARRMEEVFFERAAVR